MAFSRRLGISGTVELRCITNQNDGVDGEWHDDIDEFRFEAQPTNATCLDLDPGANGKVTRVCTYRVPTMARVGSF